jgi:hypothetical protein
MPVNVLGSCGLRFNFGLGTGLDFAAALETVVALRLLMVEPCS